MCAFIKTPENQSMFNVSTGILFYKFRQGSVKTLETLWTRLQVNSPPVVRNRFDTKSNQASNVFGSFEKQTTPGERLHWRGITFN